MPDDRMLDDRALAGRESDHLTGQLVMPFYLICDQSYSMEDELPALRTAVADLVRTIEQDPIVDDTVMLSMISFGTDSEVTIPLSRLSGITVPERLSPMGGTDFGLAWRTYRETYEADFARLKAAGTSVFRPCVFFMTDGYPFDADFRDDFDRTIGRAGGHRRWPYVLAFGFGEADKDVLARLAYPDFGDKRGRWFLARSGNVADVLRSITGMIAQTVVTSGQSTQTAAGPQITPPEAPRGAFEQGDAVDAAF